MQQHEPTSNPTARIYQRPSRLHVLAPGLMISLALLVIVLIIFLLSRA